MFWIRGLICLTILSYLPGEIRLHVIDNWFVFVVNKVSNIFVIQFNQ
jgi:hypothetical protein